MDFSQCVKNDLLGVGFVKINMNELVAFLQGKTYITKLSLIHCGIGDGGAEVLAESNLAHLTELDLRGNNISDVGAEALANSNFENLTKLDLHCNSIDDKGAEALARGNFTNLTHLSLGGNDFGSAGEGALKRNLKSSTSLTLSSLSDMDIMTKMHWSLKRLDQMVYREVGLVQAIDQQKQSLHINIVTGIAEKIFSGVGMKTQDTSDQQQESSAQAVNDTNMQPRSELNEMQPISRSQPLNSLCSNGSEMVLK